MNATLTHRPLAEALVPGQSLLRSAGLVLAFSALTALSAQVRVLLPFTPVPITGQTFAVLLTGVVLGPRLALLSLLVYLAEGAAGLPVFAGFTAGPAVLVGPTGGYLAGMPLAAWLVGHLALRGWDRRPLSLAAAMVLGNAVIYALGLVWLGVWLAQADKFSSVPGVLQAGMVPFLLGDALKILLAMALVPGTWRLLRHFGR